MTNFQIETMVAWGIKKFPFIYVGLMGDGKSLWDNYGKLWDDCGKTISSFGSFVGIRRYKHASPTHIGWDMGPLFHPISIQFTATAPPSGGN